MSVDGAIRLAVLALRWLLVFASVGAVALVWRGVA